MVPSKMHTFSQRADQILYYFIYYFLYMYFILCCLLLAKEQKIFYFTFYICSVFSIIKIDHSYNQSHNLPYVSTASVSHSSFYQYRGKQADGDSAKHLTSPSLLQQRITELDQQREELKIEVSGEQVCSHQQLAMQRN